MKLNLFLLFATALANTALALTHHRTLKGAVDLAQEASVPDPADQEVCFSPKEPCDIKLEKFIRSAQKSLDIAIYDLTHPKIAHEILVASKRIPVRVLVDRRQTKEPHSLVSVLVSGGVKVRYGTQRGIMHNKFALVDGARVETGSFNYTDGATFKNNENQIYLFNPEIAKKYAMHFTTIWEEGKPFSSDLTSTLTSGSRSQ